MYSELATPLLCANAEVTFGERRADQDKNVVLFCSLMAVFGAGDFTAL